MVIRDLLCCALTVGLATTGCGKKKDDGAAGKGSAAGTGAAGAGPAAGAGTGTPGGGTAGGSASEAEVPLPPVLVIDKAGVQQVLDAWLAAQNAGDFAAYQGVYADKMEGVKRVGERTWRFDRKGWLADRERMFKHPMTVAMRDVEIGGSALAPVVELVQSFKQGKFADEGTKRIVLAKTAGGFKVAREEMLKSVVASTPPAGAGAGDDQEPWLTLVLEGAAHVVIDTEADDAWGTGRSRGPFAGAFHYATRNAAKAPAAASWTGREVVVYDAAGKRCPAKVGALSLISGGTPHFGEIQMWQGMDGEPAWSQPQRARAIYDMGTPMLVGALTIEGGCVPVLATSPTSTAKVFTAVASEPAREAAAIKAFRKLSGYAALQAEFVDTYEGKGAWIDSPSVKTVTDGARTIVIVSGRDGSGCGDFAGALSAVFEDKSGKLTLLSPPDQAYLDVQAVLDVDGDGQLELIGSPDSFSTVTGLFAGGTSGFAPEREVSFPYNDCAC